MRPISNVLGVDDAPFRRDHRGDVVILGAVCTRTRLDGVLRGRVRRDGRNASEGIARMLLGSAANDHVQAVLLEGITMAGFNVVDIHELRERIGRPVVVLTRRLPDFASIEHALKTRVRGGTRKWKLIERAGEPERIGRLLVQRAGIERAQVAAMLPALRLHGHLPEPLRLAHLIAATHG